MIALDDLVDDKPNKALDSDGYYVEDSNLNYYNLSYSLDEEEDVLTALSVRLIYVYR